MYLSARWGCRVRSGAKVALHVLFSEVLALTGLSSLLSVRVCAFQSAFALPEGRGEREREKERQLESALRTPQYREAESKRGGK